MADLVSDLRPGTSQESKTGEFVCPECLQAGDARTFKTASALGRHRSVKHHVPGMRRSSKRGASSRPKRESTRAVRPRRQSRPTQTMLSISEPDGLTDREHAAFRLGVLQCLVSAIESGDIPAPPAIFKAAFQNEMDYRRLQLEA